MESTPPARAHGINHPAYWVAGAVIAAGLVGGGLWYWWPRAEPAPRSDPVVRVPVPPLPASPFLNTGADAVYVGDQACAGCHSAQHKSYRQHPMGRSLYSAADFPPIERFDDKAANPFE